MHDFRAEIDGREHEALRRLAGVNRGEVEAVAAKLVVHSLVGEVGGDELQRHKHQQRIEEPAHRAECREPLADREVSDAGRLERREVAGVDVDHLQPQAVGGQVCDPQPHRLDASLGHVDAEHAAALGR